MKTQARNASTGHSSFNLTIVFNRWITTIVCPVLFLVIFFKTIFVFFETREEDDNRDDPDYQLPTPQDRKIDEGMESDYEEDFDVERKVSLLLEGGGES